MNIKIDTKRDYYARLLRNYFLALPLNYTDSINMLKSKFHYLDLDKIKQNMTNYIIAEKLVVIEQENNGQLPEHLQTIINEIILETM